MTSINRKVYFPADAITKHEDFDVLYPDGDTFMRFEGLWEKEKENIKIFGAMGGQMGRIQPDAKCVTYYLKLERWEYNLHPHHIFRHYAVEGMRWDMWGTPSQPPCDFIYEDDKTSDVHIRRTDFQGVDCFEVKVRNVEKLRIAVAAVVGILIKEEYKGLSEGEPGTNSFTDKILNKIKPSRAKKYEDLINGPLKDDKKK